MNNRKNVKVEKTDSGVSVSRGHGAGWSAWDTELSDRGAQIRFSNNYQGGGFNIHFGYTTPTLKDHSRSIALDLNESIKLLQYLQQLLVESALKTEVKKDDMK